MTYQPDVEAVNIMISIPPEGQPSQPSKPGKVHCCPHEGCTATFRRADRLARHLYTHIGLDPLDLSKERRFGCTVEGCSKSYFSKSHLDRHIKTVHASPEKDIIYSCPVCIKTFSNRQNLKRHIKVVHTERTWFRCERCNIDFQKKSQLSAHMYRHTGVKAFTCELCSLEFVTNYDMKRHMRFHRERKCDVCHMEFNQWVLLQQHKKTMHHPPDQFICDTCGKTFRKRCHIVRHVNVHDSARAFQCPVEGCPRSYARRSSLKQHIIINHVKVTHDCDLCDAKLSTKAKLNEHVVKMHLSEPRPKIVKTRATGRKPRKDIGIPRISLAAKLAGLKQEPRPSQSREYVVPLQTEELSRSENEPQSSALVGVEEDLQQKENLQNNKESSSSDNTAAKKLELIEEQGVIVKTELIEIEVDLDPYGNC